MLNHNFFIFNIYFYFSYSLLSTFKVKPISAFKLSLYRNTSTKHFKFSHESCFLMLVFQTLCLSFLVHEMLQCANECSKRQNEDYITFGEFCVYASELKSCYDNK